MRTDLELLHSGKSIKRKRITGRRLALASKILVVMAMLSVVVFGAHSFRSQKFFDEVGTTKPVNPRPG